MARRFIAIELEAEALHLAVAAGSRDQGVRLIEVRTCPCPEDEGALEVLRRLQQELQPGIGDVVEVLVPAREGYARVIDYPFKSRRKLADVVPPDFFYRLPVDREGLEHDYFRLPGEGEASRVVVAATASETVGRVSRLFAAAEFPLSRLSLLPWPIGGGEASGEPSLVSWVRADEAGLALCDGRAIRRYALWPGKPGSDHELASWLLQQAALLERQDGWEGLPVRVFGTPGEVCRLLAQGGRGVVDASVALEVRVEPAQSRVAWLACEGLRSRAIQRHNFLRGEFAPSGGWDGLRRPLRRSLFLAVVVVLLVAGIVWSGYLRKAREAERLAAQAEQLLRQTFPEVRTVIDAQRQMESQLQQLRARAGKRVAASFSPLSLLRGMSERLPAGVDLVLTEWALTGKEVRLEGSTASFEEVNRLAEVYAALPGVEQATVAESKTGSDGRILFRMRLVLGGEP